MWLLRVWLFYMLVSFAQDLIKEHIMDVIALHSDLQSKAAVIKYLFPTALRRLHGF